MTTPFRHHLRDAAIATASFTGLAALHRAAARRHGPLTRILCLHDVPDRDWFSDLLDFLVLDHRILTPHEFQAGIRDPGRSHILLTFDDGYQSWIDVVLPLLGKHQITAMFFLSSGALDAAGVGERAAADFTRERLRLYGAHPLITWDGARSLVAAGHTIGAHTRSHADLSELSVTVATRELCDDKSALEHGLGVSVTDFAYPFGTRSHFTDQTETLTGTCGFRRTYSAVSGYVHSGSGSPFPRTLLEIGQDRTELTRWLSGSYDIVSSLIWR